MFLVADVDLPAVREGAERVVSIDCSPDLDTDPTGDKELVATVNSVVEMGYLDTDGETILPSTDLTLANGQPSSVALVILGRTVIAGQAVMFTYEGEQSPRIYIIDVTYTTDKVSPIPQVNVIRIKLPVV